MSKYQTWKYFGRHYSAEIDPLRLIWIDPTEVEYRASSKIADYPFYISEVKGGDWDREFTKKLTDHEHYASFWEHFVEGVDWENTKWFKSKVKKLENGKYPYNCASIDELKRRCQNIDQLYSNIKKRGYKSQTEVLGNSVEDPIENKTAKFYFSPSLGEVEVVIARNGEIMLYEGNNRFSIAKILECEQIPVRVKMRHEQWQEYRDYVIDNKAQHQYHPQHQHHPDISYI